MSILSLAFIKKATQSPIWVTWKQGAKRHAWKASHPYYHVRLANWQLILLRIELWVLKTPRKWTKSIYSNYWHWVPLKEFFYLKSNKPLGHQITSCLKLGVNSKIYTYLLTTNINVQSLLKKYINTLKLSHEIIKQAV